jgi:hypothetical protein
MHTTPTAAALITAFIMLTTGAATVAVASGGASLTRVQQTEPTDPVTVVENFLLARDLRDLSGATLWSAAVLELQDTEGQRFMDAPTTSDWLRQLTDTYWIERQGPLVADGTTVSWIERLTRRSIPFPEALHSSLLVEVHAAIRDGKIASLSGRYPPVPLRSPAATPDKPGLSEAASSTATVAPGTLFVGSAIGLSLTVLLAAWGGRAVRGAVQRGRDRPSSHGQMRR